MKSAWFAVTFLEPRHFLAKYPKHGLPDLLSKSLPLLRQAALIYNVDPGLMNLRGPGGLGNLHGHRRLRNLLSHCRLRNLLGGRGLKRTRSLRNRFCLLDLSLLGWLQSSSSSSSNTSSSSSSSSRRGQFTTPVAAATATAAAVAILSHYIYHFRTEWF